MVKDIRAIVNAVGFGPWTLFAFASLMFAINALALVVKTFF